jgi:hypothetical protein
MKQFRIVSALSLAVLTCAVSQTLLIPSRPEIERELGNGGFTRAFGVETLGVCAATLVALAIPPAQRKPTGTELEAQVEVPAIGTNRV